MDIKEALTFDGLKYFYTKYIKPLKTGAFSTVVNNATTTVANTVLDGRMGKTLADKDANLQNQINTLNSSLENLCIKTYDSNTLKINKTDNILAALNKLPKNKSEVSLFINSETTYGEQVRQELANSNFSNNFYGYLFIRWMYEGQSAMFFAVEYNTGHSFIKMYTNINGETWSTWKQVS